MHIIFLSFGQQKHILHFTNMYIPKFKHVFGYISIRMKFQIC